MQPATIIPLIALVSDIRGVCKAGVTFQITFYIIKLKYFIKNCNKLEKYYLSNQ